MELCVRLARFKKENKELLTFLLFESHDEQAFIDSVKAEIEAAFAEIDTSRNLYFAKKSIRKILRQANKYIRFAGSKHVEAQLLIFFCATLLDSGIRFQKHAVLHNLYKTQLKKLDAALATLHEDLQYDYRSDVARLHAAA